MFQYHTILCKISGESGVKKKILKQTWEENIEGHSSKYWGCWRMKRKNEAGQLGIGVRSKGGHVVAHKEN